MDNRIHVERLKEFIVTHTDINPYIKLRYIILRQNISQFKYMEVGCIDMDNRIHVERLKEQYNILANLIANIPTELGETNVNIVTGYDTFEDQTIFELQN